ncbi:hypothetical protein BGX38DRAFT_1157691 [Terfezia claveryi]|nr:hypothetical protein BGX38DRAFT_1157691 [Terfezia claveryi]
MKLLRIIFITTSTLCSGCTRGNSPLSYSPPSASQNVEPGEYGWSSQGILKDPITLKRVHVKAYLIMNQRQYGFDNRIYRRHLRKRYHYRSPITRLLAGESKVEC